MKIKETTKIYDPNDKCITKLRKKEEMLGFPKAANANQNYNLKYLRDLVPVHDYEVNDSHMDTRYIRDKYHSASVSTKNHSYMPTNQVDVVASLDNETPFDIMDYEDFHQINPNNYSNQKIQDEYTSIWSDNTSRPRFNNSREISNMSDNVKVIDFQHMDPMYNKTMHDKHSSKIINWTESVEQESAETTYLDSLGESMENTYYHSKSVDSINDMNNYSNYNKLYDRSDSKKLMELYQTSVHDNSGRYNINNEEYNEAVRTTDTYPHSDIDNTSNKFSLNINDVKLTDTNLENENQNISYSVKENSLNVESYTPDKMKSAIEVVYVEGKGRCLFAKQPYASGDIILIELPTLVAVPSLDPPLWETLKELNAQSKFDLPPIWHLAALYSLIHLPKDKLQLILDKWVPDHNKSPSYDVMRVLHLTKISVNPHRYERLLQAWRYNSFGHHIHDEGISMIAHDCSASATWHYGENDAFILRARQHIPYGKEVTISYIGDEDLISATHIRQEKLSGWLFTCKCKRCSHPQDVARGFRCPTCGAGTTFFKTVKKTGQSIAEGVTKATKCTLCRQVPLPHTIKTYLEFEDAYICGLDEIDRTDPDLSHVEFIYSEAQRIFTQHWGLHTLDTILFEGYRDSQRWNEAATHQSHRIKYISNVIPKATYTLAWLYEELGDILVNHICSTQSGIIKLTGFQKNLLAEKYETAMNILFILCGPQHEYTITAYKKLNQVFAGVLETEDHEKQ